MLTNSEIETLRYLQWILQTERFTTGKLSDSTQNLIVEFIEKIDEHIEKHN